MSRQCLRMREINRATSLFGPRCPRAWRLSKAQKYALRQIGPPSPVASTTPISLRGALLFTPLLSTRHNEFLQRIADNQMRLDRRQSGRDNPAVDSHAKKRAGVSRLFSFEPQLHSCPFLRAKLGV